MNRGLKGVGHDVREPGGVHVSLVTPMNRGLKEPDHGGARLRHDRVSLVTPMNRGLKAAGCRGYLGAINPFHWLPR